MVTETETAFDRPGLTESDTCRPFATSLQHILAELERIDLFIQICVRRSQQIAIEDPVLRGFYISEEGIEEWLARPIGLPTWSTDATIWPPPGVLIALERLVESIARRKARSIQQGISLRLETVAHRFGLTSFDVDTLLICLAPEIDLRYERLYAYLQDDMTRKDPSVDLVLNLLSPSLEAKLLSKQRFAPNAPLFRYHLLEMFNDPARIRSPLLSKCLKVDDRIANYLFDGNEVDERLLPFTKRVVTESRLEDLLLPADVKRRLGLLVRNKAMDRKGLILYFQGPYGVGKRSMAEALGRERGKDLLVIDGTKLLDMNDSSFETAVRLAVREALLQDAVLFWDNFDALLEGSEKRQLATLLQAIEERSGLTILAGNAVWEPAGILQSMPFVRLPLPIPDYEQRLQLWSGFLGRDLPRETAVTLPDIANKFRLSGGQIRDAAATADNLARWRNPENGRVTTSDLHAAARLHSNRKLAELAVKIEPHYTWQDIVLPPDRLEQLREICNTVRHRALVYETWGFERKLSLGKGLNVLFAGPSGTGKTMAAEIMANELGLDLYKIDLSTVVSKYIGETEKNLARIFAEAETSNAILFFDEADALFGKRSEVRDSHDRYANIEISYLLQKMEEYEGVAILATNLRQNLDEAFARRMAFTIHFPFPEQADRLRIWQIIWPAETPRSQALDLPFMARQFKLTGGNIRNIALAATFLAAGDGQVVEMAHLVRATRRELQKMGKTVVANDFGEFAAYLRRAEATEVTK